MTDKFRLLERLKRNPKNVRFNKLCKAAEAFGFEYKGGKGSHRIYIHKGIKEMLNFQNVQGKAKPYQVRQLIKVIEKYNLLEEKDDDA
ncbi:MAG: type II toxin-antitoxin system HicA family toxin [Thermoplasmata archaeon]|nr:MAG: type II toxin-antitoxin system HicA family toxin [Thermoplasmata archaeon]